MDDDAKLLTVLDFVAESERMLLTKLYPIHVPTRNNLVFAASLFDRAFGHLIAMRYLATTRLDLDASIEALARPCIETAFRSFWVMVAEDRAAVLAFEVGTGKPPSIEKLVTELDKKVGRQAFSPPIAQVDILHDLTHGGSAAAARHFHPEAGIGPQRDALGVARTVLRAGYSVTMVGATLVENCGGVETARPLIELVNERLSAMNFS